MSTSTSPQPESLAEFTFRAVAAGLLFGALFGAANAYLGLRVGLTVSTSIPIAVLSVAFFRLLGGRGNVLLEANISQTTGSAASSLASGTIFTIPALFLWGLAPPYWQIAILALLGGLLGIAAMVPLRRLLIVKSADELPYPEGTACAQVLRATATDNAGGRWIFRGLLLGAGLKLAIGGFALLPGEVGTHVPGLPKGELTLEIAAALLAVGYILGYRQSAVMVAGSLISSLALIPLIALVGDALTAPLPPETQRTVQAMSAGQIWSRYVRYIGAGAVAAAGIVAVARSLPTMYSSLVAVIRGLRTKGSAAEEGAPRTDRDVPGLVVVGVPVLVVLTLFAVPGLLAGDMGPLPRLVASLGVAVFGLAFVVVSSRIVGLIGVSSNPTSGMALVTLLGVSIVFVALGWTDASARAAILTVGTVVCVAASKAGDISQDLKTGYLVGATPARQQMGQFLGAAFACWAVAGAVLLLHRAHSFGSAELPAPQATLMKTVIEGVLAGALPWGLVGSGAALSISAILCGLPGLSFAVGIYLPLATLTPIFLGGLVRYVVESRREGPAPESDPGVLAASGMIAGEGLTGVAIAFLLGFQRQFSDAGWSQLLGRLHFGERGFAHLSGAPGTWVALLLMAALCAVLFRAGQSVSTAK